MSDTRTEVERFITYIEDELCKRMDIDDFDGFFTELATELMRRYGPSVPADFGDNCLTCGLYIESCKEKPAPTPPEAVREAMENADIIAKMPIGERDSLDDNLVDLAAYVRELEAERLIKIGQCNKLLDDYQKLEAERDRLKKLIENIATSVYEKINIKGLSGLYLSVHIHKDTWAKIQSELAGARKGRG